MKYSAFNVFKRIFLEHIIHYKKELFYILVSMILLAICNILFNKDFIQYAINYVCTVKSVDFTLIKLILMGLGFCICRSILEAALKFLVQHIGYKILFNLQGILYNHVVRNISYINLPTGKILSKFSNDILMLRGLVCTFLFGFIRNFMNMLAITYVMINIELRLSCIVFIIIIITMYVVNIFSKQLRRLSYLIQLQFGKLQSRLNTVFSSLRSTNSDIININKPQEHIKKLSSMYQFHVKIDSFIIFIFEFASGIALTSIIIFCCYCQDLKNNPGKIMAFYLASWRQWTVLKSFLITNTALQEGLASSIKIFKLIDENKR